MPAVKIHLEEVATFIREHRSSEAHFDKLYAALIAEIESDDQVDAYKQELLTIKDKAAAYKVVKNTGGTSWPEFEKFTTAFERAVIAAAGV